MRWIRRLLKVFLTFFALPLIVLFGTSILLHKTITEQVDETLTYSESIKGAIGLNADTESEKLIKTTYLKETHRHITIYYEKDFEELLPIAKESLDWSIERNAELFGEATNKPVDLFVFSNYETLNDLSGFESAAGTYSDFFKTMSIHYANKPAILEREPSALSRLQRIVYHEYTHYALNRKHKDITQLPIWLIEGLSEYVENDNREVEYRDFATLPFEALVTPEDWEEGMNVPGANPYDQGYFAVKYLTEEHGERVINDLLASVKDTKHFEQSLEDVTGMTFEELHDNYLIGIKESY